MECLLASFWPAGTTARLPSNYARSIKRSILFGYLRIKKSRHPGGYKRMNHEVLFNFYYCKHDTRWVTLPGEYWQHVQSEKVLLSWSWQVVI